MFLTCLQISQESTCIGVFFKKVAGPQNFNFVKKRLHHRFTSREFSELFKSTYFAEDLWTAGSGTSVLLYEKSFFSSGFFWQFQVSRLQLYSSKEILAKMFVCEFYKIFKNIFRQSTSGWLHLWILRSFSDHLLYRAPLRNCLFHAKVAGFQPQNTIQNISQVLFKHFIQKQEVAIPRRSFT